MTLPKTGQIQVYAYKAQESLELDPMLLNCIAWPELRVRALEIFGTPYSALLATPKSYMLIQQFAICGMCDMQSATQH